MEGKCNAYSTTSNLNVSSANKLRLSKVLATTVKNSQCYYCQQPHTIYKCPDFLAVLVADRTKHIAEKGSCQKCFSLCCNKKCKSVCRQCNRGHNSLLHDNHSKNTGKKGNEISLSLFNKSISAAENPLSISPTPDYWIGNVSSDSSEALLATVQLNVSDLESFVKQSCHALVDSASQLNLITSKLVKSLNLNPETSYCNMNYTEGR